MSKFIIPVIGCLVFTTGCIIIPHKTVDYEIKTYTAYIYDSDERLTHEIRYKASGKKVFRDLDKYGSRGEQRMGVLWLKLRELSYVKDVTSEAPTLLLDDIFSELDHEHRDIVMDLVKSRKKKDSFVNKAIITTADPHFVEEMRGIKKIVLK